MKKLAIIDGKSVFYRGYYAMPGLSTKDGTPTGGVFGFASLALEMMRQIKPDYVAVAWDKPKTNIRKRLELYPEYKAGRKPAPPDFYEQIPILHQLLEAFGWPLYECDDYEADDIMATLDREAEKRGDIETYLITSDLDALQILDKNTFLYALKKGFSNIEKFDVAAFEQKYGIKIGQFLDLKSLKGDSSDNIPGVAGVGEKTAISLLQQFDTLDGVYEHLDEIKGATRSKLEIGKESAYLSKELARLYIDAPVPFDLEAMDVRSLDTAKLRNLLQTLEFRSLLQRLPDYMQHHEGGEQASMLSMSTLVPAILRDWDEPATTQLAAADYIVMYQRDEKLYVSSSPGSYSLVAPTSIATYLASSQVVTHDGGRLIRYLLAAGIMESPELCYDTKQAAFLLDPLRKSRSLTDLMGIDEADIGQTIAAIWSLHGEQQQVFEKLPKLKKVAYEIDFPLIPILARMEHCGIILDTNQLAVMSKTLTQQVADIQRQMYDMVGYEFNISSPAQLAEVLFTKLQLSMVGIKKGKTGYSTGQKELDKLRGSHPIIECIERYRELTKLLNTYVDALPKLVDASSRLHTTFNQDVAATGRLSSTDPNLQNIPIRSEAGRLIREAFVPATGNVFVSADYSQFELRLAAVLAGDQKMINDFNAGTDIHAKTAADVYKIPLDAVTKAQRRDAKVINFGVLYGMSPHGLAAATGMSFHDAKVFIDEYFRLRAPIRAYIDATIAKAKHDGFVETYFGRRRPTPDVKSSNFIVRQAAERAAANMPIQGTEADLMKMAMIAVEKEFGVLVSDMSETTPANIYGWQVLQIHDSILVECPRQNAKRVGEILKETMENIYPQLGIRLDVDVTIGNTWGEV